MEYKKLKTSRSTASKLSVLKRRTGLNPNLISRIAICFSLEMSGIPPLDFDEDGKEFNRYTLTGSWDSAYTALLKERMHGDGLNFEKDAMSSL